MVSACLDEPDCFRLDNYYIGIAFKKLADSTADTVGFTTLRVEAPPLIFTGDTLSKIFLRVNQFQNETAFFFDNPDTTRVLRLGYSSKPQFVSEDCGERFVLTDLRILQYSFDSVRVLNNTPSSEPGNINIEIFQ
jgi:hypothetical protein